MSLLKEKPDNPDQRISEDIHEFVQIITNLFLDFANSLITLVTFIVILWNLSYVFSLKFFGYGIKIYGFLVWAALIYSIFGTYLTKYIGSPLAGLLFTQETKEANFRFSPM